MEYLERINAEIRNEEVLLTYTFTQINLKVPTIAVKSIYKGCKVKFFFYKDSTNNSKYYLHTACKIYDNLINPLIIINPNRFIEDYTAIKETMTNEKILIAFYNELGFCMRGYAIINQIDRKKIIDLLGNIDILYVGNYDKQMNNSLDMFENLLNKEIVTPVKEIQILEIKVEFIDLEVVSNVYYGSNEYNQIDINDIKEGDNFEKQIWALLNNVFLSNLHKNPKIIYNSKMREFTDILAFYELGIFLIETKAMSIINLEKEQPIDRKVKNVQNQILKGINQLVGAKKALQKDLVLFDNKTNEIQFDKTIIPHCIVLVNEIIPFGNWIEIENKIEITIKEEVIFLNVMGLSEFRNLISYCYENKERLDYYLMKRTKFFMENKNIFITFKNL